MTKMIKKSTGVKFTPQEFRLLAQCVRCGKAGGDFVEVCKSCSEANVPSCSMCEILMRNGVHKFYTYDIKEEHRSGEVGFKVSKELVREFEYEMEYDNPLNTENLCGDCIGWQKDMKNRCRDCKKCFINTKENYQSNGNFCAKCSENHTINQHESESGNDGLEREGVCEGGGKDEGV